MVGVDAKVSGLRYSYGRGQEVHRIKQAAKTVNGENIQRDEEMSIINNENYKNKKEMYELIRDAYRLKPNETSRKLLMQAIDDLNFVIKNSIKKD